MVIKCSISGKNYKLLVLNTNEEKKAGLRLIDEKDIDGVFFYYNEDTNKKYTFKDIGEDCIVYFLNHSLDIVGKCNTLPYQKELCGINKDYRYVIELIKNNF